MQNPRDINAFAVFLSLVLHAAALALAINYQFGFRITPREKPKSEIVFLAVIPPTPKENQTKVELPPAPAQLSTLQDEAVAIAAPISVSKYLPEKQPASMAAPAPPTAEEWAFAGKYTNKNSKGYRYSWGKQVRSMMGTSVEGPDQGIVRFRVEIAPNGTLAKLDTLWTTSAVAEQLARKAIQTMPPLPPTPTGKSLIFEKTISFTPYATDDPPIYKDDCLPDRPSFKNQFAWDGKSPQTTAEPLRVEKLDPQSIEECFRQLPQDSIEAEMARDKRAMERWGWTK